MRTDHDADPPAVGEADDDVAENGTEVGGIVVLLAMLAAVGWYFLDAVGRSTRVENLILIVPMSIAAALIGGGLLAAALLRVFRARDRLVAESAAPTDWRLAAVAAFLLGYAFSLDRVGLDVSTALFLGGSFAVLGVRGWVGLMLAPIAIALVVIAAMKTAFYIHIPTVFLGWL